MEPRDVKILLIEDDEMLLQLYTDILREKGYRVDTANDGTKAFEKIKKQKWNLILCDIVLPQMNGFEVITKARDAQMITEETPVIFLTNMYTDDQNKQALKHGKDYIIKSQLTPDQFLERIEKFIK